MPVILTQLFTHRQSRNDSKKRDEKMGFILSEHIPHTHGERQGALFAEGIRFPRGMNGK